MPLGPLIRPCDRAAGRDHLVVCGDDALALRMVEELTVRYGEQVTVILPLGPSAATGRRSPGCPASGSSSAPSPTDQAFLDADLAHRARGPGPAAPGRPGQLPRRAAGPGAQPGPAPGGRDLQHQPGRADPDVLHRLRGAVGVRHGRAVVRRRGAGRARAEPRPARRAARCTWRGGRTSAPATSSAGWPRRPTPASPT